LLCSQSCRQPIPLSIVRYRESQKSLIRKRCQRCVTTSLKITLS
jgi:hypothetical protein